LRVRSLAVREQAKQVALVTGSSSGFGLLASVELARRGLHVVATMRDPGKKGRLLAAARDAKVELEVVRLDVTQERSIEEAVKQVGAIDVLVNNAGFGMAGFLEDLSLAELREQFETNFFGLVAMTKAVVPGMRERGRGRIINVSSIAGRFATPGMSAYVASKFAVEGFSETLRLELIPYGVYVVLVEPGTFKTDIFDKNRRVAKRAFDESSPYYARTRQLERVVDRILARSKQDPADVARTIAAAAVAKKPRLRYLVGRDAKGEALAKALLPSKLLERAVLSYVDRVGK
jgi:NAD(P)-dependent dehydrogenase (short-subunit alcohol dehydrogenase family)